MGKTEKFSGLSVEEQRLIPRDRDVSSLILQLEALPLGSLTDGQCLLLVSILEGQLADPNDVTKAYRSGMVDEAWKRKHFAMLGNLLEQTLELET